MNDNFASTPFVSVIIPVFNDSESLQICLSALEVQTYPSELYEVVVVDNNSQEDISLVCDRFSQAKLVRESQPGSYVARNRGVSVAKGELLAFTDADCIPSVDWLTAGVEAFLSDPNMGLVAGRIDLFAKDPENPNPFELYEMIAGAFPQDKFVENGHYSVTANLFTSKAVISAVGPFDKMLKSGGDKQWGQRVYAAGYQQRYSDDAWMKHPARDNWEAMRKRGARIIGGRYDQLKAKQKSQAAMLLDLVAFMKPPFRYFFRILKDDRLNGTDQKLQFTLLMLRLRKAGIQERIRLQFGGTSERG